MDPENDPEVELDEPELDEPEDEPEDPPEQEPELDPEPTPEPEQVPQQNQGRAKARIERQQAELKALREESRQARESAEAANRQMAQWNQQQQQARQAEMLANMDPEQRNRFEQDQRFQGLQRQVQEQQWALQETMDKTSWQTRAASDKVAAKYTDKVEQHLLSMRKAGNTATREGVYFYLLGQDMAAKGPKAVSTARSAADRRVASASGEPMRSARSTVNPSSRRADPDSIEALEERLKGQII
jgi:hypothetical protein